MKTWLLLLPLLASAVDAQSQSVPCGSPPAAAAAAAPSRRPSSVAAKAGVAAPTEAPVAETAAQSANPRAVTGGVAAQIRPRPAPIQSSATCRCGTVAASSLTAPSVSQEVPILTALQGNFRFDHVLVQETTRFSSESADSLVVGVGRASLGSDVVSPFALESNSAPNNFWYERPTPPQLTGSYDLVLNFKASSPLGDGNVSNFSAGVLTWEVCGYNGPRVPVR